jgi:hypothetical protein
VIRRRSLLTGLGALIAAPAAMMASKLFPANALQSDFPVAVQWGTRPIAGNMLFYTDFTRQFKTVAQVREAEGLPPPDSYLGYYPAPETELQLLPRS